MSTDRSAVHALFDESRISDRAPRAGTFTDRTPCVYQRRGRGVVNVQCTFTYLDRAS